MAQSLISNDPSKSHWSTASEITPSLSYCFILRLARYGIIHAEHSIRDLSQAQKDELLEWITENQDNVTCFSTGVTLEFYSERGIGMFSPERIGISDGDSRQNYIDSPGQITVAASWGSNRLFNKRNVLERNALMRLICGADFSRGRRVLLNSIKGGAVPRDAVWIGDARLEREWDSSYKNKYASQEQAKREQFVRVKQPTHIVPDIRQWSEQEMKVYNKSFGGIDCILGVDLGVKDWSCNRITGWYV